jgi:hypothetical protein
MTLILFTVAIGHLALQVLLKRDLVAFIEELGIHSAETLGEEGVATRQLEEEFWLVRGNHVTNTLRYILGAGIEV